MKGINYINSNYNLLVYNRTIFYQEASKLSFSNRLVHVKNLFNLI